MNISEYFKELEDKVKVAYVIAEEARSKGLDPLSKVEIPLATSLAGRVAGLVSTVYPQLNNSKLINRIFALEKEYGNLDPAVALKIAEEIAKEKFCKFTSLLEGIDAGIRVGIAYMTLGVVASPIEGFTYFKLNKTQKGENYFAAYFSGPIRSAGGTAAAFSLVIIDHLREIFGYARYDATEQEVKRAVTEIYDYHERITNLQYLPSEEEIEFLAKNLPIQVTGEPSEDKEVSNYKDLARIETNLLRSGFCLVLAEGLAQKAAKILKMIYKLRKQDFKLSEWDFLKEFVDLQQQIKKSKKKIESATYIQDLVAGRPVLGHPSKSGAFRLRYGRARNSGYSCLAIHPATMHILGDFIAIGSQMKIELPTKGAAITSCDSVEGPIVKMNNDSVRKIKNSEEAEKAYADVCEILYLGDLLVPYGDFLNRNHVLMPCGYTEEQWHLELKEKDKGNSEKKINPYEIDFEKAISLSKEFNIPLHPEHIYFWSQILYHDFVELLNWLNCARIDLTLKKLILPYNKTEQEKFKKAKRALELIGCCHDVTIENVILSETDSKALLYNLGLHHVVEFIETKEEARKEAKEKIEENEKNEHDDSIFLKEDIEKLKEKIQHSENVVELVNTLSKYIIIDKAGTFIGARMGRPEKAKLRKLTGNPNVLFPVGDEGGRLRSVQAACEIGTVKGDFPIYFCENCNRETIYFVCEACNKETRKMNYCKECQQKFYFEKCPNHAIGQSFANKRIDIPYYLEHAAKKINLQKEEIPILIKGVRGTSSTNHILEHLAKGILRTIFSLCVNKDGTIRYDATELPLMHFKAKETGTDIETLKKLGYDEDIEGKPLENDNQILELKPHDVVLPACPESPDEGADDVLVRIAKFIDSLLVRFYNAKPFYNANSREDLIGHLITCIAPHNSACVIARIIGFSKAQAFYASPYLHAACRRDCVYPTTKFVCLNDSQIKEYGIGEYVEKLIDEGAKTKEIDSFGTLKIGCVKEIYALGVDPVTKKLKKKKIKYFIKAKPPENWIKIKTATGREQIMTPRHKFIYLDKNNTFRTKKASEIEVGDKVAILNNLDIKQNKQKTNCLFLPKFLAENVPLEKQNKIRIVNAKEFFKQLVKRIGKAKLVSLLDSDNLPRSLNDWYNIVPLNHIKKLVDEDLVKWTDIPEDAFIRTINNNKKWNFNFKLTKELMNVLGYYAAEGYCRQNKTVSQICFRIIDNNQRKNLISSIERSLGLKVSLGEDKTKITIGNKLVYFLFKYCFRTGFGAYNKNVPDIVLNSSPDFTKNYLSSYFDGDGTIVYQNQKNKNGKFICFYSVNRQLLEGIALLACKFGLVGRFSKTRKRLPGKKVLERYKELRKKPKKHVLYHLTYLGPDFYKLIKILKPADKRKLKIIKSIKFKEVLDRKTRFNNRYFSLNSVGDIVIDFVKETKIFKDNKNPYCFEIEWDSEEDKNVLWSEQIINARCDGDECAFMLLLDTLINFSKEFLPAHRGGTQDAPLVLNARIHAGEVDDMVFDVDIAKEMPLELYKAAWQFKHPSEIKIEQIRDRIGKKEFTDIGYTHETNDINEGVLCSSYKKLVTMQDKVQKQMELVEKIRAVNTSDVARLVIERHFIRDIRGNLRKFSMQEFRCSKCNEKYRRPPMQGNCLKCKGNIIFTISEGSIVKYLEPALNLAEKYNVSDYLKQSLELTKSYIESIFGREKEKQEALKKWF